MVESVYFTSLEIENVRCFGDRQELDLTVDGRRPVQWTLILGDNGVGKTTLLQCLAWMRLEPVFGPGNPAIQSILFDQDNEFLERLLPVGRKGDLSLSAKLSIGSSLFSVDNPTKATSRGRSVKTDLSIQLDPKGKLADRKFSRKPNIYRDSLIVAYGADRYRGFQNLQNPELEDTIGTRLARRTELYDVEEMLSNLHYASETNEPPNQYQLDLKRFKAVLTKILPGDVHPDAIRIFAPDSLGRGGPSGVNLDTITGLVSFSELSLGYQTTLAWTADFAWRLLRKYPESKDPFAEPAVLLIDEIDLHLHPRWQLDIIKNLSEIFPATQFIATSHSPLMAQVAESANFVLLNIRQDENDVKIENDPEVVKGWRVDQILTSELFGGLGARSPETELLFTRRDELIAMPVRSRAEESELESLRAQIANLPTAQYPGDRDAMNYIREAAALLRKHGIAEE